jgi:hypothetical protein
LAAVLLIVLWVRSYHKGDDIRTDDDFQYEDSKHRLYAIRSLDGTTNVSIADRDSSGEWEANYNTYKRFSISRTSSSTTISFPNWFPTLISLVLTVAPWLRYRFSLRTLLIVTTLVAVVLGLIVYTLR